MMPGPSAASTSRNGKYGFDSVIRTVSGSIASTAVIGPRIALNVGMTPWGGSSWRFSEATTSAEVNGVPSWNLTPCLSLKVYTLLSADGSTLVARSVMIVRFPSAGSRLRSRLYNGFVGALEPWARSKWAAVPFWAIRISPPRFGLGSDERLGRSATTDPTGLSAGWAAVTDVGCGGAAWAGFGASAGFEA